MGFGSVIRAASSPGSGPSGIGGNDNNIWHCNSHTSDFLCELSTTDFSVVRSSGSPSGTPKGIGGDANTIWHCDYTSDQIYEISTTDFSVIRNTNAPASNPEGIGGDANTIWHCDHDTRDIYELSIIDLSTVRSTSSPATWTWGIGGKSNKIWHIDSYNNLLYDISTVDFSVIRSGNIWAYGDLPEGVGGDASTIWYCVSYNNRIKEIDADVPPTYVISGNVQNSNGINLPSISITLEDGTDYSTSTNDIGDYSQVVIPDVYDVTASLSGHSDQSASVDATTSNQTQNFIFPVTTAPLDKAIRLIERHLLE